MHGLTHGLLLQPNDECVVTKVTTTIDRASAENRQDQVAVDLEDSSNRVDSYVTETLAKKRKPPPMRNSEHGNGKKAKQVTIAVPAGVSPGDKIFVDLPHGARVPLILPASSCFGHVITLTGSGEVLHTWAPIDDLVDNDCSECGPPRRCCNQTSPVAPLISKADEKEDELVTHRAAVEQEQKVASAPNNLVSHLLSL